MLVACPTRSGRPLTRSAGSHGSHARAQVLAVCAALAAGCSGPPASAPCRDFDCSGHGACVVVAGPAGTRVPTCRCHPGYHPSDSGWLCLPAGAASLCSGIDCAGHGRCASVAGAPRCLCDPGYAPLEPLGRSCVDVCRDVACGDLGRCEATADGPSCRCEDGAEIDRLTGRCAREARPYLTYRLVSTAAPDLVLGHATVDLTQLPAGRLIESAIYDMPLLGLSGRWRQVWTLATDGPPALRSVEIDQILGQGRVVRRRSTRATFDGAGGGQALLQRLDRRFHRPLRYHGPRSPLPMPGGFEYPGWTPGALSPASYLLLLARFGEAPATPDDPTRREVEVLWPATATTATIRLQGKVADDGSGDATIELLDLDARASYREAVPHRIELAASGLGWRLVDGMPRDSNLPLAPPTSELVAPPPPPGAETSLPLTSPDGTSIAATITRPSKPPPGGLSPALLLVNPPEALDRQRPHVELPASPLYQHLADLLAAAGYVSLRYEPRQLSDRARLSELVADGRAAHQALAAEPDVDRSRIYLLSHGAGSLVSLRLLAEGVGPRGVIALAPLVAEIDQATIHAEVAHLEAAQLDPWLVQDRRQLVGVTLDQLAAGTYPEPRWRHLPASLWGDLLAVDGRDALLELEGPVLLVRGAEDLITPAAQLALAEQAAAAAGKANLTAITLDGLAFDLAPGDRADLWERAHFPLELPGALLTTLLEWLGGAR